MNKQILELVNAIKLNNLHYITNLLSEDHLNWRTTVLDGSFPAIHLASVYGKLEIVQLMLNKDASLLNLKDEFNQTPILFAAAYGHEDLVNYLVTQGAQLNGTTYALDSDVHGRAPVHWAIKNKHPYVAECLIKHGVDINLRTDNFNHLIHHAAKLGYLTIVQLLLDKDKDLLNLTDELGRTPISYAASNDQWHVVDFLASKSADLTLATIADGKLPIHYAAECGSHNVLRCLIKHRADIDVRLGEDKLHIIHLAVLNGHLDLVNMLLEINSQLLNLCNALNQTPLLLAITEGDLCLVKRLLTRGASLNVASGQGEPEIIKFLLDNNPDWLEFKDDFNQMPTVLAAANGHAELVKYFMSKDVTLNGLALDLRHGRIEKTLLMWAMNQAHYDVANLFILKLTENQNKTSILPYITNGLQALELMKQKPSLIKMLLADKNCLELLIKEPHCHISEQTINWYNKSRGRRLSFFACMKQSDEMFSVFEPAKRLGEGGYGVVRLFQNPQGDKIAVKSPINIEVNRKKNSVWKLEKTIAEEVKLNRLAYPNDKRADLFHFKYTSCGQQLYENRYVMAFVGGEHADAFIAKIIDVYQLAQVVFEMAQELQRIHNIGILHGDIYQNNILIYRVENKYVVRYIDFGHSLLLTAPRVQTFVGISEGSQWYAPELCSMTSFFGLKPHTNQDVYSLGFLLNWVLGRHACYQHLIQSFPSIEMFIIESQKIEPLERPTLAFFCEQLNNELNSNAILSDINTSVCKI